jgi:hypothetical protein
MRRWFYPLLGLGCALALLCSCYGGVLFHGGQFGFRDAAHFYYPLYQRVQQEWEAGRWPLWSAEENSGMPLLGNPTAAVLYPGKVLYWKVPYAWGARLYVVAHTILAVGTMYVLVRSWGVSRTGAGLAGLSYGFGAPILFQYCNVVFLVGAAWLPLGVHAADQWLRLGRRWGVIELAIVLAMQTLGGEPQSAYLLGLCAASYAICLDSTGRNRRSARLNPWLLGFLGVLVVAIWVAGTIALAAWLPTFRAKGMPTPVLPWIPYVPWVVLGGWALAALALVSRWLKERRSVIGPELLGLVGAALLAGCLAGAQLVPVLEYSGLTARALPEGPHDIYPFSLAPQRFIEWVWPGFYGDPMNGNKNWLRAVPPRVNGRFWSPSLYLGGLTLVLAIAAAGFRHGPPWRAWMTAVATASFIAGLGEHASPIWYARRFPEMVKLLGPPDPGETQPIRSDGHLRDGDGSPYWMMSTVLPGFRTFRYPGKMFTFTCLALCALAGAGWDRVLQGRGRLAIGLASLLALVSLAAWAGASAWRGPLIDWLQARLVNDGPSAFGPFNANGAWADARSALSQGAVVYTLAVLILRQARRYPRQAGACALVILSIDLAKANAHFVCTVPQSLFEAEPRVLKLIEDAERADPAAGLYRVHRMPHWSPVAWYSEPSQNRVLDFDRWEHDTLQPKYGIPYHLQYTLTAGTAELFDYQFFFAPFQRTIDEEQARYLRLKRGEQAVYYPRRGFNLWNTRYFVLPRFPRNDEERGIYSLLYNTEAVYPRPSTEATSMTQEEREKIARREDFQIVKNKSAFPRAWIVHELRFVEPIVGMRRAERKAMIEEMLFSPNDPLWRDSTRVPYDPATLAWIEAEPERRIELLPFAPGGSAGNDEDVRITKYEPQRVELEVALVRPGVVVLSDVFYPGWHLLIDGKPSPVLRTNRMMRGAAVPSGKHQLVYVYDPRSFHVGLVLSAVGVLGVCICGVWAARSPDRTAEPPDVRTS